MLEQMLRSTDRTTKEGLDALVACYLVLKGAEGLPLVEELLLTNKQAEYSDTYAAIMALRFHGTELSIIPRSRLVAALRHILDRPELADLVIADLARWEDWSVMPRLVQLFKEADQQSSWVRVPVINYLRACPLPEAKQHIQALAQIDPDAVKRANTFFPFAAASSPTDGASRTVSTGDRTGTNNGNVAPPPAEQAPLVALPTQPSETQPSETQPSESQPSESQPSAASQPDGASPRSGADVKPGTEAEDRSEPDGPASQESAPAARDRPDEELPATRPRRSPQNDAQSVPPAALRQVSHIPLAALLAMCLLLGLVLLALMWLVLRGAPRRRLK